jgi:Ser/Thr protein kinase RdoA (MazF antagonist)
MFHQVPAIIRACLGLAVQRYSGKPKNPSQMPINHPSTLFAGVDNASLDTRVFNPSALVIERVCRFFSIGEIKHTKQEPGLVVSHSNFIVFVTTTSGKYVLKFYPPDSAKSIAIEYAINRFLKNRGFPTPTMHAGEGPFLDSDGRLATCFSYINGQPAWQNLKQPKTIIKINGALVSLKDILSTGQGRIPFPKQKPLIPTIDELAQTSRESAPFNQKKMIDASLQEACQSYQKHKSLFIRQALHNNANLTNFLIDKETVYLLDLSHVREDYALADLSSLIISSLFLNIAKKTIRMISKAYFKQNKIGPEYLPALHTLFQIGLIKEYLKNSRRENSTDFSAYPTRLVRTYRSQLSARQKLIAAFLAPKAFNNLA